MRQRTEKAREEKKDDCQIVHINPRRKVGPFEYIYSLSTREKRWRGGLCVGSGEKDKIQEEQEVEKKGSLDRHENYIVYRILDVY